MNIIEPQAKFYWTVEAQPREDLFETDFKAVKEYKEKRKNDRKVFGAGPVVNLMKPEAREVMPKSRGEDEDRARLQEKMLRGPASFQVKSKEEYLKNLDEPKRQPNGESAFGRQGGSGASVRNPGGQPKNTAQGTHISDNGKSNRQDSRAVSSTDQLNRGKDSPRKPSNVASISNKDSVYGPSGEQLSNQGNAKPLPPQKLKKQDSATIIGDAPKSLPKKDLGKPTVRQQQLEADLRRMKVISDIEAKARQPSKTPSPDQARQKERLEEQRRQRMKEEVKAYKDRLKREEKERLENERKQKEIEEKAKREKSRMAMRDRKKALEGFFKEEEKKLREKSMEAKKKHEEEKALLDRVKKEAEAAFKNEREKIARENYYNDKIQQILNSVSLKPILTMFEPQLRIVFKHYIDSIVDVNLETRLQDSTDILHFHNFMAFANQFNIVPALLSIPEIKVMYRSCTRHKNLSTDLPIGLDFKAFAEMLLRIALKKHDFFKNMKPSDSEKQVKQARVVSAKGNAKAPGEGSALDLDSEAMRDFSNLKSIEDAYAAVDSFDPSSLEGLCTFLDMPSAKNSLTAKLNGLRRENVRTKSRMELVKAMRRKYMVGKDGGSGSPRDRSAEEKVEEKSVKTLKKGADKEKDPKKEQNKEKFEEKKPVEKQKEIIKPKKVDTEENQKGKNKPDPKKMKEKKAAEPEDEDQDEGEEEYEDEGEEEVEGEEEDEGEEEQVEKKEKKKPKKTT